MLVLSVANLEFIYSGKDGLDMEMFLNKDEEWVFQWLYSNCYICPVYNTNVIEQHHPPLKRHPFHQYFRFIEEL